MITAAAMVTPVTAAAVGSRMESAAATKADSAIADLTAGLASGNDDAFKTFHYAYFDRLLRYLTVVASGDENAAREALQETYLRVARHARRFESEEIFWSWLTVLARSAASDYFRKRNRYWRLLRTYAFSWIPFHPATAPAPGNEPELESLLVSGVEMLEPPDRALLEGKYLQGASVRELARDSGLTEKAVESRLLRIRRQLREQIARQLKHEKAP